MRDTDTLDDELEEMLTPADIMNHLKLGRR